MVKNRNPERLYLPNHIEKEILIMNITTFKKITAFSIALLAGTAAMTGCGSETVADAAEMQTGAGKKLRTPSIPDTWS